MVFDANVYFDSQFKIGYIIKAVTGNLPGNLLVM